MFPVHQSKLLGQQAKRLLLLHPFMLTLFKSNVSLTLKNPHCEELQKESEKK